jgi:hypothetical protein
VVKVETAEHHPSGAKQVAEERMVSEELPKEHPSGAKAHRFLSNFYGTAEAVPFQNPTFTIDCVNRAAHDSVILESKARRTNWLSPR